MCVDLHSTQRSTTYFLLADPSVLGSESTMDNTPLLGKAEKFCEISHFRCFSDTITGTVFSSLYLAKRTRKPQCTPGFGNTPPY